MKCSYCDDQGLVIAVCRESANEYAFRCIECDKWQSFSMHKDQPVAASNTIPIWDFSYKDRFIVEPLTESGVSKIHKVKEEIFAKNLNKG